MIVSHKFESLCLYDLLTVSGVLGDVFFKILNVFRL